MQTYWEERRGIGDVNSWGVACVLVSCESAMKAHVTIESGYVM